MNTMQTIHEKNTPTTADIPLIDALIEWNPDLKSPPTRDNGRVRVSRSDSEVDDGSFDYSAGVCYPIWAQHIPAQRLEALLQLSWVMILRDRISVESVARAFNVIPEWREFLDRNHAQARRPRLLTAPEKAAEMRITLRTLSRWRRAGRVPHQKISQRIFRYYPGTADVAQA